MHYMTAVSLEMSDDPNFLLVRQVFALKKKVAIFARQIFLLAFPYVSIR